MPTNLSNLKVSLTKHGAHKIAYLIEAFDPRDILNHIYGDYMDINIELAQTKGNLSISDNNQTPEIWFEIKKYGREDIFDLTFLAIVFSHHDLLMAMKAAFDRNCMVRRGEVITGKAYTNFAHTIEELGFSIQHTPEFISFDISRIFYKFYLIPLVRELLSIKLKQVGWDSKNSLTEECLRQEINKSLGLEPGTFIKWLDSNIDEQIGMVSKANRDFGNGIIFKAGHNDKLEDDIIAKPKNENQRITLVHNRIQNRLFPLLVGLFPHDEIGTEVPSSGGSIDLVRRTQGGEYILYEIKTSNSSRINIRLGIPQLLEYAYWKPNSEIQKLIVIGPCKLSEASRNYLTYLRNEFKLKIFYQHHEIDSNTLSEEG